MGRPTANVQIQSQTSPTITAATPTTPVLRSATSSNSLPSADNSLTLGQQIVRKEQERREAERLAKEQAEKERVEQEKLEKEKLEAEERGRIEEERRKEERKDRERRERERREMERKMLEREDAERREREMERLGYEGAKVAEEEGIDERVVVPDYVHGLMRTLKSDQTLSPTPEDFSSPEGYSLWQRSMGISLQEVLCDLLKVRFLDPPPSKPSRPSASGTVDIFFKIVEARGLHAKEGRTRDAYCKIEIGDIADPAVASTPSGGSNAHRGNTEVYMTEVVKQSLSPVWNQHLEVSGRKPGDWIVVSVWDVRKDYFLGLMRIRVDDIMEKCSTDGFYGRWFRLEARGGKNKDKYVGGEILIEINVQMQQESSMDAPLSPIGNIQSHLLSSKISFKALYRTLLRSCLDLDMFALGSITEATSELLSSESRTCLRIWARTWLVGDAFQVVAYLELLFMRYQSYRVPVRALLNAYEAVYANMKQSGDWLTEYDKPALVQVLEEMQTYYRQQVSHYQEFYAKNKPDEALESTVLMLRMIHKNPIYREIHPDLPTSFRVEIETIMNEASRDRFQKLQQLAAPLDENDVEAVVEGLTKLTELLTEDVITDARYFRQPFENEVDIVRLTAESYVSNLVQTFEANASLFAGEEVVKVAGKEMFGLYTKLKTFDERLDKAIIKKVASYPNFNIERWFAPFVSNWLENLSTQTLDWVNNAVKVDAFDVVVGHREDEANPPHSSSVTDLFTAVFQELEFVAALRWRNEVQSAAFFQKFAKTMNKAVEQYCDAIGTGELKAAESATTGSTWSSLLQTASSKQQQSNAPKDITNESCVKLCNVEFALRKLDDMYIRMNVATLARTMKDYRATLHPPKPQASTSPTSAFAADDHTIKGAFKLQLSYAENIKPVTNAGLASAYLVVRVPEGTLVPPPEIDDPVANVASVGQSLLRSISSSSRPLSGNASPVSTTTSSKTPIVLTGSLCEIARTRVVHDTLNPSWDETFTTLLPPVTHLEVLVYSRNLLTADELCGKAFMEFDPSKSRLRRKLADHLTHDVFLDLEPQGRVLIRMTLEGEEEDVDFWFRRSRERLLRTRDDFVRALNNKISPYLKEVILKSLKEHEAAPVPSKSFFTPLLSTVQLSNVTAQGASIDQSVTSSEADTQLAPLTDYLNKNLEILIASLSTTMAQEVIKRVWDETLTTVERSLIPPLFGQLEKDRRWLNRRQVSMAEWAIRILKDFFHADGHELGLPLKTLENRRYADLSALVAGYHADLPRLRREYEMRKEKELILRLVRLRIEKQEDLTQGEREEGRKWIETQLMSRKEKK
ncbi:hypothetical protein BC829DRAFT_363978 [Chytridium lagenaria]|nr:hypothetical protein BC829DRAFT_363978 [Chytridium lagenaria]